MKFARRREGFTLAEVLISSVVVLMTIGLFVNTFVTAKRSALLADERIKAVHFARVNMETLLTNTYYSSALSFTNRPNWMTNYSVVGGITSRYVCSYGVRTGQYTTAKIIVMTNSWYSKLSEHTNSVTMATAVSSGFQW